MLINNYILIYIFGNDRKKYFNIENKIPFKFHSNWIGKSTQSHCSELVHADSSFYSDIKNKNKIK